jgi:hypothetical protein
MPVDVCLGKKPAVKDMRVPRLSKLAAGLPPPPPSSNWYADVEAWQMLSNDQVGDCVDAAAMHIILQQMTYTMAPSKPLLPTDAEAIAVYSANTGYDPTNPSSDQGSYVLGPNGLMQYWLTHGITCGGILNKPTAFLQITRPNAVVEWQQAISLFGSLMIGMRLPDSIVSGDTVPYVWADPTGPIAGGHEILLVGYRPTSLGTVYDLVSWGQLYRATEDFLLNTVDEAVCVIDPAFFGVTGLDPAGLDMAALTADMELLRGFA